MVKHSWPGNVLVVSGFPWPLGMNDGNDYCTLLERGDTDDERKNELIHKIYVIGIAATATAI